jgi:hypothetical protein
VSKSKRKRKAAKPQPESAAQTLNRLAEAARQELRRAQEQYHAARAAAEAALSPDERDYRRLWPPSMWHRYREDV